MSVNGLNTHKMNFTKWYIYINENFGTTTRKEFVKGGALCRYTFENTTLYW